MTKKIFVLFAVLSIGLFGSLAFAQSDSTTVAHKACIVHACNSNFDGFYGEASVTATLDKGKKDLSTDLTYFAIGNSSDRFELYAKIDSKTGSSDLQEAFVRFKFFDLDFNVGKQVVPFGINYLSRPSSSVFVTTPNQDAYVDGFGSYIEDSRMRFDGFYGGGGVYSLRAKAYFFDKGFIPSMSYNDQEQVNLAIETYFDTALLKTSLLGEWHCWNGNTWARTLITPGFYDRIGVLFSYYNTSANLGLQNFDFTPDAWTYGLYCEVSKGIDVTAEWKSGETFRPVSVRFATTF
jgi:hypothetical protein